MSTYTIIGILVFLGTFLLTIFGVWKVISINRPKEQNPVKKQTVLPDVISISFPLAHQLHAEKLKSFMEEMVSKGDFDPQRDHIDFSIHRDGKIVGQQMDIEDFMNY